MDIKNLLQRKDTKADERKKPNKIIICAVTAAAVILAMSSFFETDKSDKTMPSAETVFDADEYAKRQEERLEMILERINGAGKVAVYITIEGGGEKVTAKDVKTKITKDGDNSKTNGDYDSSRDGYTKYSEETESTVVSGNKSTQEPYITERKTPEIGGVLVVASGAASEKVRLEIYEAVKAVYGIAAHRIKVTY